MFHSRREARSPQNALPLADPSHSDEPQTIDPGIWKDNAILALDVPFDATTTTTGSVKRGKKRPREETTGDSQNDAGIYINDSEEFLNWIEQQMPGLFPSVPSIDDRPTQVNIANPFIEVSANRYPHLRTSTHGIPEGGACDGYIKFRIQPLAPVRGSAHSQKHQLALHRGLPVRKSHPEADPVYPQDLVPSLPPNFEHQCALDPTDNKLLKFYTVAFCGGRTLLTKENFWLVEFTPMAVADECVRHALLAFISAYVLDFVPKEGLRRRANDHYRKAAHLLDDALADPENLEVGRGDNLVAAMILLFSDDIVQWELRKAKGATPRWREGAQSAKKILDMTDPGYRYWKAQNVQSSRARVANANRVAFIEILALLVTPLKVDDDEQMYSWLLEGTEREVHKIHDGTGLSPKLLHILAQITHLAARLKEDPDSDVLPYGANELERRLESFCQWSELSEGYASPDALFSSCSVESDGRVRSPSDVTDLTGQAWLSLANLYLQCRFFRKPRSDPLVLRHMDDLARCVSMMPDSGPLFTSQSPFCPIFLMGMISYQVDHRRVVQTWFETQCSNSKPRSSVPPVWRALQAIWQWTDNDSLPESLDEYLPIGRRLAWWELIVDRIMEIEGQLSLC